MTKKGSSCGASDQLVDNLCTPPEVCANVEDSKEQHLLAHAANPDDPKLNFVQRVLKRDKPLLVAIMMIVIFLRVPFLKYTLYPFLIFSTWVHEMCHGMAAVLVGGGIEKLYVYKDGSGLCYTWTTGETWRRAIVASAGYTGTAVIGAVLLVCRRTRRGPTVGLIGMGIAMLLSCAFYVRNAFGILTVLPMGIATILGGWKLPQKWVLYLYCFMAATCSFNALDSVNDLMDMRPGEAYVNGEESSTDAHTVADLWGMTYRFWAFLWLVFGIIMSAVGLFLPFNGLTYRQHKKQQKIQAIVQDAEAPPQQAYYTEHPQPSAPPAPHHPQKWYASTQPQQQTEIPIVQATIF